MVKEGITIRGLDRDLLYQVRKEAVQNDMSVGEWINEAIREKLITDFAPIDVTDIAHETEVSDIWEVPLGTVRKGKDYCIKNRYISSAGRKGDREAVTSRSPALLAENGYKVYWLR